MNWPPHLDLDGVMDDVLCRCGTHPKLNRIELGGIG
jgi:hypothetical protein